MNIARFARNANGPARVLALLLGLYVGGAAGNEPMPAGSPWVFSLIDQSGTPAQVQRFRGDWLLVFFGFTSCPDVCPGALATLRAALGQLGPAATRLKVLFVSVDPDHDSPAVLKRYLQPFGPQFIGLTGTRGQISAAERSFGVYSGSGDGALEHSSKIYLMSPGGCLETQVSAQITVQQLTRILRERLGAGSTAGCESVQKGG